MSDQQQVRCQRIGCNALFLPDSNAEDSCCFHPGPPLFHDGGKEWSCCKQRSHDFSLFLDLPGCAKGKHATEKPEPIYKASTKKLTVKPIAKTDSDMNRTACSRCKQGFFCSDHGPIPGADVLSKAHSRETKIDSKVENIEAPKAVDLNVEQVCKNCKKSFTEKENHDTACNYHPGPPVFHDRSRGWACCDVHVKEFDEFLTIPACTKGWHKGS